jgi:hypothetical protein
MNAISVDRSRKTESTRLVRGIVVTAVSSLLIVGLTGCMTERAVVSGPAVVQQNAPVPAGIDPNQPADRIAEQIAQQEALNQANSERFAGRPADRVAEELAREALPTTVGSE